MLGEGDVSNLETISANGFAADGNPSLINRFCRFGKADFEGM